MTEDQKKLLNDLKNSPYGRALLAFLKEEYDKINDVDKIESWDDALGRKYALKTLKKLFSFIEDNHQPRSNNNQYL